MSENLSVDSESHKNQVGMKVKFSDLDTSRTISPKKLLLIIPNNEGRVGYPPYNIAILKAFIDQKTKHSADIADLTFHKSDWREYIKGCVDKGYDLIGISMLSFEYVQSLEIATFIKSRVNTPIIFGGVHVTLEPDQVIENDVVDIACTGDGEFVLKDLLDRDLDCDGVEGIYYKARGEIIRNERRVLTQDLDGLAYPDWEDFELEKYFQFNNNHLSLMVSRGCPYLCTYCNNHAQMKNSKGKYVRFRSVEDVITEIGATIDKYYDRGFRYIQFIDDIFILNRHWVMEFCKQYKAAGFHKKIKWMVSVRANLVREDLMQAMFDAGCYEAGMGVESANDYIRNEVYLRKMPNSQIYTASEIIKKTGMLLRVQFIIGAPFETVEMMEESLVMAKKIDADVVMFSLLMPLPKTAIADLVTKEGMLAKGFTFENAQVMYSTPVIKETKHISAQELRSFYNRVRLYQIKKYILEGLRMKKLVFIYDLAAFMFYYKHKYKLEIQNAFKFTIKKYKLEKVHLLLAKVGA